jgi:hypothetical protein
MKYYVSYGECAKNRKRFEITLFDKDKQKYYNKKIEKGKSFWDKW